MKEKFSKCVVKIAVTSETDRYHIDDVIYYRSGMTPDFVEKWMWFFEYITALVKVHWPRRKVELYSGPQEIKLGSEWHDYRRKVLIRSRERKLKELSLPLLDDDLFHFKSTDIDNKKKQILEDLEKLNNDTFPISEFPEYINKLKDYLNR